MRLSKLQNPDIDVTKKLTKPNMSRFHSVPHTVKEIKPIAENPLSMTDAFHKVEDQTDSLKESLQDSTVKVKKEKWRVKQNFTFRKRNVKDRLMLKINDFVDVLNDEEKKNVEMSKRYGKALQSLSEQLKTSYNRFRREEIAQDDDIVDMKKQLRYLSRK